MPRFAYSSLISAPVERVFAFHESPGALERLMPPWQTAEVVERSGGIEPGAIVVLRLRLGPVSRIWRARHVAYRRNELFIDVQDSGPFRSWTHRHEFARMGPNQMRLTDSIEFSLPGGALADFCGAWLARLQLRRLFAYRHAATRAACERG